MRNVLGIAPMSLVLLVGPTATSHAQTEEAPPVEAVPDHLSVHLDLRTMFALDNRVPNAQNNQFGLRDMNINVSFGVRVAY